MLNEEWRPVVGFEKFYEISNLGNLRSIDRVVVESGGKRRVHYGRVLSISTTNKHGYYMKCLYGNGFKKGCQIHRLVAEAFIPNPNGKEQVNHKNGVKTDNRADNLEWVSRNENAAHAVYILKKKCGNYPKAVLCVEDSMVFPSINIAAKKYCTSAIVISRALSGEREKAVGKHWKIVTFFNDVGY